MNLRGLPIRLRDCDANLVPLCRPCHDWVESPKDDSGRKMLRKLLGSAEAGFAIRLLGEGWFERRYPATAATWTAPEPPDLRPSAPTKRPRQKRLQHLPACSPTACMYGCPVYRSRGIGAVGRIYA